MAELKEIKDEGWMSSVTPRLEPICLLNQTHVSQIPVFDLHRASTGSRRIDLCLGGI
jgi:hypothetical protein